MKKIFSLLILFSSIVLSEGMFDLQTYTIKQTSVAPEIDGLLNDAVWDSANVADNFIQFLPQSGAPGSQKTEVRVLFDERYIYVAARMFDDPEKIAKQLLRRDNRGYSQEFGVSFDSYNDNRTGFSFYLTPKGSKSDLLWYNDEFNDRSWDAIWDGETTIDEKGWTAEFRIPLSQIRYDKDANISEWGLQFYRYIARNDEHDYWSPLPGESFSEVAAYGIMKGIENIPTVPRYEIQPYVSGSLMNEPGVSGNPYSKYNDFSGGLGADLKIGLGSNFTLTGTINPDFGQVEADPAVVNLTDNETFFAEKRPFFIEGSDILRFGSTRTFSSNLPRMFYSRRVGRPPQGSITNGAERFSDYPDETTIAAAIKISGKTSNGLSFGMFDAITTSESAVYTDTLGSEKEEIVEPLANILVSRIKKDFNNGNTTTGAYFGMVNRNLSKPMLKSQFRDRALITGVDFEHRFDSYPEWVVSGVFASSFINGSKEVITRAQKASQRYYQRPDAKHINVDENTTSLSGHSYELSLMKNVGEHWVGSFTISEVSPGFEVNDMGFQTWADYRSIGFVGTYRENKPGKIFRSWQIQNSYSAAWNFGQDLIWAFNDISFFSRFNNFWYISAGYNYSFQSNDDRMARGGPIVKFLPEHRPSFGFGSDRRKQFSFSADLDLFYGDSGSEDVSISTTIKYRPTSYINLELTAGHDKIFRTEQFVKSINDSTAENTFGKRYIFSELKGTENWFSSRFEWTVSPDLTVQIIARPFISAYNYYNMKEFAEPKTYKFNSYGKDIGDVEIDNSGNFTIDPDGNGIAGPFGIANPDFNYFALQTTSVVRWEFKPGSILYFVWQQDKRKYLSGNSANSALDYIEDFKSLFNSEPTNIFRVKLVYWLGS
jgi:uncharacterized protein DUF5916/cellulose/xylan binding protein with CBM9 domain